MSNNRQELLNNRTAVGPQGEGRESPSTFPKYPAYKDSGVEWLGDVPESWTVTLLKRGYEVVLGKMLQPEAKRDDDEFLPYLRAANIQVSGVDISDVKKMWFGVDEKKSLLLRRGDLLVSEGGDVGRSAIWDLDEECYFQNSINRIRSISGNDTRFLYFWMITIKGNGYVDVLCNKSTIAHFTAEKVAAVPLPIPSIHEQTQIARFLDHETARIDALIEEQQRLIELLKEKRQAVISHAVTKGLNPDVPMKDSGVEWLGQVPAHWAISKLGHYASLLTGFPFPSSSFSSNESHVRLLRGANVGVGALKWTDTVYWDLDEDESVSGFLMKEGQIVLGMDRPWISDGTRIARVTCNDMPCLLLQRVAAITPDVALDGDYLYFLLSSGIFKSYVEPDLTGVSVPHISPEQILSFQVPVPMIEEQRRIGRFIKNQLEQMANLLQVADQSVELLQERRAALISATVTGKIDVRGWQPPADTGTASTRGVG